jgi:hypothetical protein
MPARTGGPHPCGHLWRPTAERGRLHMWVTRFSSPERPVPPYQERGNQGQAQAHGLTDGLMSGSVMTNSAAE